VEFDVVEKQPDFPALEERVLARWRERDVFRQSLRAAPGAPLLRCYDGPPTANGRPGVHHVEARVFKDIMPRYFTMKGYRVPRRAGWDCHGIPVELEIERELGFTGKQQIEEYGVAEFNARCRESVTRYVEDWKRLTERTAYWVDMDDAYWTMSSSYVESVWWSIKEMFDRGLLYEAHRVVPYCPRCGTALSDHEVAQGYEETDDLSVYARLPLITGPLAPGGEGVGGSPEGASLLIWTTVPWTILFSSLAVIGTDIRYVLARGGRARNHLVVLAADLVEDVLGPEAEVIRDVHVDELLGSRYRGAFEIIGPGTPADPDGDPTSWRFVVAGDFVTTAHGTGIVSTAPSFGEDDMRVARGHDVPIVNAVDTAGRLDERMGRYAGVYVRDANPMVLDDLRESGLLVHSGMYRHVYPFCWRCATALIYYAKPVWYIATTRFRDRLLEENATVDWRPEHIRDGRYGDWIANNVDWALSRDRYWGTPLPLWRCTECRHTIAVGSLADLSERAGRDLTSLDPHRPHVDEVTLPCEACETGTARRVPEVIDAWYDSGAMPYAQFGYPHVPGSREKFEELFPADYTAEAIDQTRGWWYSLHAIATILFDRNSYLRALCLGHIVDTSGRKMSKSLGNVLNPWELIRDHGADAMRWLFLVEGSPWQARRVGEENLRQITRRLLLTIWNTYYFLVTYARLAGWHPGDPAPAAADRPVMDRYALAELADTVDEVDAAMSDYDIPRAGRRLAAFVDDLSNWYVRRSRERFWNGTPGNLTEDSQAAFATLSTCLSTLAVLLAPFTPFLADELYESLVRPFSAHAPDSVHLVPFPVSVPGTRDEDLRRAMAAVRRLVTLGRDARAAAGVPVRCPLQRAVVTLPAAERPLVEPLRDVMAAELNVRQVRFAGGDDGDLVKYTIKPNFRAIGPLFGARTPAVAAAIEETEPRAAVAALRDAGALELTVDGEAVSVGIEAVQVLEEPVTGWQVSTDGLHSIAVDLEMTPDLRLEWLARELIRRLNDVRKQRGLEISDRIHLTVDVDEDPSGEIDAMLHAHWAWIGDEVLATTVTRGREPTGTAERVALDHGSVLVDLRVVDQVPRGVPA